MKQHLLILTALSLAVTAGRAGTAETTAAILFSGTSTLHDFEGTVISEPFPATFIEDAGNGTVRVSASAALSVQNMSTEHKKRDKNMFKMLDRESFNLISGTLADAELPMAGNGSTNLRLKIRDVEQDVPVTLSDWKHEGSEVSCRMAFEVSLKDFGLKAPSVLGLINVGDTVKVECELEGTCL